MADIACPVVCQPVWPACWLDTPGRSSLSSVRVVQDVWDVYRDVLAVVPQEVVLALRDAVSRSTVDDFWTLWSRSAEAGLFRAILRLVPPLSLAALPFLAEVCYEFVASVWETELLAARVLVSCIGSVMVMMWMFIVLSSLLTPLLLLWYSFVGVLSLLQMCLKVSGIGLHSG